MSSIDQREFRNALGSFATGVTVVTTSQRAENGDLLPIAVTANSFSSVSLDPALVLWSIDKSASSFAAFQACDAFAIHILHDGQRDLSQRCASSKGEKLREGEWQFGELNIPLVTECKTRFECQVEHRYKGGDHIIMVGRVVNFERCDNQGSEPALLYYQGQYEQLQSSTTV